MGVAARFALATAATIAVSFVAFGLVLYRSLAGTLNDEIDESGVLAARALAVVDAKCWMPFHETALEGFESDVLGRGNPPSLDAEKKAQFDRRSAMNLARATRLAQAHGTKLLAAVVIDPRDKTVLSGAGIFKFDPGTSGERRIDEVAIAEGNYTASSTRTPARTYSAPILDEQGLQRATAIVALSAEEIDASLSRVLTTQLLLTALFIGVGVAVAFVVSRRITRPIQTLCQDIETVARGHLEHRTHPHSADEIGVLARTFDRMTQNLAQFQEVQKSQAAQSHQIEVAREVQAALHPERLPAIPGFECAAGSRSTAKIVGDFYDVSDMAGGAKLLAVVSASGTGVPGAMVATMARSLVKALAGNETSPAEMLRKVNHFLAPDLRRGMYVSALLLRVEPAAKKLVVANAGHHPLVVCRNGGERAEPFHSDGIALGFDKGPIFDRTIKDREVALAPGERVLLCTRSTFAIKDASGAEIGEEAVYELFQRESPQPSADFVALTLASFESFREGAEANEDITFLTLKRVS
jgi:serine phosphatase RsbU (regulator of sigma subunit)